MQHGTHPVTVLLFAKAPVPGRVKTRLVPPLTFREAARLSAASLIDLLEMLQTIANTRVKIALPSGDPPRVVRAVVGRNVEFVDQGTGDLGARLTHVTVNAFRSGAPAVAVVGSDHPTLPGRLVEACLEEARAGRVGWIPTRDGGFAMMALPHPLPGLFRDVPWSTSGVAEAVRANARRLEVSLVEPGTWYDVDRPEDLVRLDRELAQSGRCPATRKILAELDPPLAERGGPKEEEEGGA